MKKNVSGQKIGAQMVTAADGSAFTGSVTVAVTGDAGTQATGSVGSGACTHEGNGYHTYAPAQAETNYDLVAFTFTGTGAVPATVQVFTSFPQTADVASGVNVTSISGDATAADTLELFVEALDQSTGQLDSGSLANGTITANSIASDAITAAKIAADAIGSSEFAQAAADKVWSTATRLLTAGTNIALAKGTGVTGFNDLDAAGIRSAVGLASANLDTQLTTIDGVADGIKAKTDNLPASPAATSDIPSAGTVADAVWEEAIADHSSTSGSTAEALGAAGSAGDPWTTALPGSYSAGQAGKIVGDYLNAPVGTIDTVVDAIKAVTDNLPDSGALSSLATAAALATVDGNVDSILVDTAVIGAAGAGLTAVPWNAAWDAEVQSEVTDALNAYDPPTNAEMEARTIAAASYATAANLATVDGIVDDLKSGIIYGAAVTGTLSTTVATTNLTGYADDQLIGRVVIWLDGDCAGEATDLVDYASTNGTLTFTALTTAPGNGDLFKIV